MDSVQIPTAIAATALALRSKNWELAPKFRNNPFYYVEGIEIELRWSENRYSPNPETIYIQHLQIPTTEMAREYLQLIISSARCIRKLTLNIQVSTDGIIGKLLDELSGRDGVQLEELYIRRRYVGQKISGLSRLIKKNVKSLRVVGKIGLGEAIESFNGQVHLERLSLINFDLVNDGEMNSDELAQRTRFFIRRLAGIGKDGLTFDHLSYTAFSGFEITKMPVLHMLRQCRVKSLRLTMQTGVAISDPAVIGPLLPGLTRLELIGNFEVNSNNISKLFPDLEDFNYQKQDLITGLVQRARVFSQFVPDYLQEANLSPVAAAC